MSIHKLWSERSASPSAGCEVMNIQPWRFFDHSRASHEATIFTDNLAKFNPQLSADISKTSALEINHTPSVAQGIGMGI